MMKNKMFMGITVIISLLLLVAGCGNTTDTSADSTGDQGNEEEKEATTIRLGHGGAHGDVLNQSVDVFSDYIKEHTDERYIVENYGASQLGNERDLIEGVSLGTVDMTLVTNAPLGNFVPEALFYDLPALYKDLDHVHKVAESPIVQEMLSEKLLEKNIRLLTVTDGGFRNITNNVRPIVTMEDFDGISMRVQESPIIMETYKALPGITPTPIPIGDLYTALEQGIADAQENPALLINDFKLYEVQKYLTLTEHSYFPRHLFINENLWQSIPDDDKEVFVEAAKEMQTFKNNYYKTENEKMIDELQSKGMEVNTPDEEMMTEFFNIMKEKVYPQFYAEIGSGDEEEGKKIIEDIIEMGE